MFETVEQFRDTNPHLIKLELISNNLISIIPYIITIKKKEFRLLYSPRRQITIITSWMLFIRLSHNKKMVKAV